jgi:long-chain acyl-CoA synthetase
MIEKLHARILGELEDASPVRRRICQWALKVGLARSRLLQEGGDLPHPLRIRYRLAESLVFKRIRDVFGGRVQVIVSGGAPISKEILEFFHAVGILTLEMYGAAESLLCTMNLTNSYRFGSIGVAAPGVQIRIAEDGAILTKSGMVFRGYLKDEEGTRDVLTEEGWYTTGDAGRIDPDGFVWIRPRTRTKDEDDDEE